MAFWGISVKVLPSKLGHALTISLRRIAISANFMVVHYLLIIVSDKKLSVVHDKFGRIIAANAVFNMTVLLNVSFDLVLMRINTLV